MASMRDIKRRKDSIQSTQQITKAMKLVSTVKLQRAKTRAENAKPYFEKTLETIQSILSKTEKVDHPYLVHNGSDKKGVIVITSNRGLAGGYNNNVVKQIPDRGMDPRHTLIYGVGRKGIEYLARRNYEIAADDSDMINEPLFSDAARLGEKVLKAYSQGEIGEIYLAYTSFKNTVVHNPKLIRLLPVDTSQAEDTLNMEPVSAQRGTESAAAPAATGADSAPDTAASSAGASSSAKTAPMNYELEVEEALDLIVPRYINSVIYGAFMEAVASENGARMQAMDAATSNAEEMIDKLSLAYNRARQGAITQELTEIISGAEALK